MYQGRYSRSAALAERRRRARKRKAVLVSLALAGVLSVGGTIAWITASTNEVENTFVPAVVESNVTEEFSGTVKENVKIANTAPSDKGAPVYVRATIIVNWVDDAGVVSADAPVVGEDYSIDIVTAAGAWLDGGDGFYYYSKAVAPGESTSNLINSCVQMKERDGYKLHVDIVSSAIQAMPDRAVEEAWSSGSVTVDANNGVLAVAKKSA